jgi:tetratricopeptide (TPR) repeat protein
MAEAHATAALQLHQRGAREASQHANTRLVELLSQLANSPFRSPLLNYTSVLRELIERIPRSEVRQRIALHQHYLAEDLHSQRGANALAQLHEIAEARLQLGEAERAFDLFTQLLRFDPTDIWIHVRLAHTLERDFPEIALAAAQRAILLLPREDKHQLRTQLRRTVEETRGRTASSQPVLARSLLMELQGKPGKRSRASLRTLCISVEPELEYTPTKQPDPLPDAAGLAQLRRELGTLPRPLPTLAEISAPGTGRAAEPLQLHAAAAIAVTSASKIGRNEPCPCGSGAKYKRCCATTRKRDEQLVARLAGR